MSNNNNRAPFTMTPEMQQRVDRGWEAFVQDPEYSVAIAQAASQLLSRRGELPPAYKRGKPDRSAA